MQIELLRRLFSPEDLGLFIQCAEREDWSFFGIICVHTLVIEHYRKNGPRSAIPVASTSWIRRV